MFSINLKMSYLFYFPYLNLKKSQVSFLEIELFSTKIKNKKKMENNSISC